MGAGTLRSQGRSNPASASARQGRRSAPRRTTGQHVSGAGRGMFFGEVVAPGGRARGNRSVRAIRARASLALALVFAPMHGAHADLVVPSGGQSTTGGGQIDLGCTDVVVGGTLLVSSGGL